MVGDYVRLIVKDDGCGMSPEVLQRIFEPFFTTKGVGQGTGLGLATAYGVIKQNNGFIVVESQLGQGTAFGIYLPRVEDARGSAVPASESAQRLPRGRGEVVLLVEDEAAILRMAKRLLERSGYAVLAAGSPLEGIRLARAHLGSIDLLITDVIMPEMSGWDMARVIRQERPKTECLFMSGYTADVIADQGVLSDDVHFIEKPFEVRDLATRVREILDPDR